jgi:lipopolysaccharide/colanic/teichoic acid biosynthesis glycosyltransferase
VTPPLLAALLDFADRDPQVGPRPTLRRSPARKHAREATADHVLGEPLYKDAFLRERKRADRFNTPFAVMLVDRGDRSSEAGAWTSVLRAVAAVRRDVDVVGWLEQDAVLGLLLPEAPAKGAAKVLQRLRRDLGRRIGDEALAALSIRLYAHDPQASRDDPSLPGVDVLVEAIADERRRPGRDAAKRALDILGSLGLLLLFGPVLLAVLAAVKWTSPGPALFRQLRIGRRGQPFTMLKFRSMYANAGHGVHQDYVSWFIKSSGKQERTGNEVFKLTNDPRITPVGHFIRRTSLDELPQFLNVLRGDMSLVGPRPPLAFEVEQYQPWHRRRVLEAKPGVTGLWQVEGRSRTTFDEMVRLDLRYARTYSLWMDIRILAATPRAMLTGKGAC